MANPLAPTNKPTRNTAISCARGLRRGFTVATLGASSRLRAVWFEVGHDTKVVAGPDAIDGLIENSLAAADVQGRAVVSVAADEDVIDASERPVGILHQRVLVGREGLSRLMGMDPLPGIPVANADPVERLAAGPESDARGLGVRVHVASDDRVLTQVRRDGFDRSGDDHRLQLAFAREVDLEARVVVDEHDAPNWSRNVDFS